MENTRKIVLHLQTNSTGTDAWEFYTVPADLSNDDIENLVQERANENAETFGIYPPDFNSDEEDEDADDNIGGSWYDYVPDKHDLYRVGNDNDYWEVY